MRIIFINCWFGQTGNNLVDFVQKNSPDTAFFCFQEIPPELFEKLIGLLPEYRGLYATEGKIIDLGFVYGQAIFVRKDLSTGSFGKSILFRQIYNDVGYMQYADIKIGNKTLHLINIHGKARPGHKLDTPVRLKQSKMIIGKFAGKNGPEIIGGDFNLLPETKSVRMFEKAGYRNLIKEFNIKDTRGKLNHRQFTKKNTQYFADYVFVSKGVKVKKFEVPYVEISDHLPLILDFEV